MVDELSQAVHRFTQVHAGADGIASTPMPGFHLLQSTAPKAVEHAIIRPLVCQVLQGSKQVTIGNRDFTFSAGDTMIVTSNIPIVSRISVASAAKPYLALAMDLDPSVITELEMCQPDCAAGDSGTADTSVELRDALRRLVSLLERPTSLVVLGSSLIREIHHWLLLGQQGQAIRNLGLPGSHAQRIARAIAILRAEYDRPLLIEQLASAAGMSRSAFHKHFLAITSLSPLQFQKQLRLIEARRLMLSLGRSSNRAAFEVGYQSVSQFNREYARMYGLPPLRDIRAIDSNFLQA